MRSNERDRLNTVARFKKGFLRKKWGQVHSLRNIRVGPDPIFLRHLFTLKYYPVERAIGNPYSIREFPLTEVMLLHVIFDLYDDLLFRHLF